MNCHVCATNGINRAAAARCRICFVTVCSQHLSDAMRPQRGERLFACGHVFAVHGWLASAVRSARTPETVAV